MYYNWTVEARRRWWWGTRTLYTFYTNYLLLGRVFSHSPPHKFSFILREFLLISADSQKQQEHFLITKPKILLVFDNFVLNRFP